MSDKDSVCDSPPTSRRHHYSPERNDKSSNIVRMILDGGLNSEIEDDDIDDQIGEVGNEDHQDQEGEEIDEVDEVDEGVQNEKEKEFAGEKISVPAY